MPGVLLVGTTSTGAVVPVLLNPDGSVVTTGGGGGGGAADVSALSKETTQQSVLTALGPLATASKQDSIISAFGPLATAAKQDSIIAKLSSDPATATKQDAIVTKLGAVVLAAGTAKIGAFGFVDSNSREVVAVAANTAAGAALAALPVALSPNSPTPAGTNTIGGVNVQAAGVTVAVKNGVNSPLTTDNAFVTVLSPNGDHARDATFAQSQSIANSLGALNAAVNLAPGRKGTTLVQVTGTFVGTLSLQGNLDGTNFVNFTSTPQFLNLNTGAYTSTITAPGIYQTSTNGLVNAKIAMTAYTSGAAIVSTTLTDAPSMFALDAAIPAGSNTIGTVLVGSGSLTNNVGKMVISDPGGSASASVKAGNLAPTTSDLALVVSLSPNSPLGAVPITSLNAVTTATNNGTALDNIGTRKSHTMQVDVTTTAVGTGGSHTVYLEGSLDNVTYAIIGTASTLASTSTNASDATNHQNISVANVPYRYIRARNATIPTGWTGTVTAKITSGV